MTPEEAMEIAERAEKKKKHEYYIENKDHIREQQNAYQKEHRQERAARSKKYRNSSKLKYAESQLRYWTKKSKRIKGGSEMNEWYELRSVKLDKAKVTIYRSNIAMRKWMVETRYKSEWSPSQWIFEDEGDAWRGYYNSVRIAINWEEEPWREAIQEEA